jgi:predicted DNA binding protein
MTRDGDEERPDSDVVRRPYEVFARVQLSHPDLPLVPALDDAPETSVRPQSTILGTDRVFVAGFGGDSDAFEAGLEADPTVARPTLVTDLPNRRVYRVELTARGRERLSPLDSAEAYVHDASGTSDGWTVRMELPDREALVRFVRECRSADIDLEVERITDTDGLERNHGYGLSTEQQHILRTAYETGYFDVPRKVSQTDLAESFDLSTSAVSQHLRRATGQLVGNTLLPRRDP